MKIVCRYSRELGKFLEEVVNVVLNTLAQNLQLKGLDMIELIPEESFPCSADGRTINSGKKIILSSRLYELLPCFNISELEGNEDYQLLLCTLYHEMGHINDWMLMPNLYAMVTEGDNLIQALAALMWLEYLAEKRSERIRNISNDTLCDDYVAIKWQPINFNAEDSNRWNFVYLSKATVYFIVRTLSLPKREKYMKRIKSELLKKYVDELDREFINLERQKYFDTINKLSGVIEMLISYYRQFKSEFIEDENGESI